MKTITKKTPSKPPIIKEADIKGPMMVYNGPRSQKDMNEMSAMAFERKAAREEHAKKQPLKAIKPKMIS